MPNCRDILQIAFCPPALRRSPTGNKPVTGGGPAAFFQSGAGNAKEKYRSVREGARVLDKIVGLIKQIENPKTLETIYWLVERLLMRESGDR